VTNPFKQSAELWLLSFSSKYQYVSIFEDFFEEKALAVSSCEITSKTVDAMPDDEWMIEVYLGDKPSIEIVHESLMQHIDPGSVAITKVENKDWTDIAASSLGEITTEKFHIVRSSDAAVSDLIPIILDLTRAFGTGEHATTMGCLEALESHSDKKVGKILDIGTGTGILAIAAKKLWPDAEVTATDIDSVAIDVAKHHADINNVALKLHAMDGVSSFDKNDQYDIVLANILAGPLVEMAEDITSIVKNGGLVILSGFLENQMQEIVTHYAKYNLLLATCLNKKNWITLILTK
jgi:ribosomal protein L11 methyltransferase